MSFLSLGLPLQSVKDELTTGAESPAYRPSFWDPKVFGARWATLRGGSHWRVRLSCAIWWCVCACVCLLVTCLEV